MAALKGGSRARVRQNITSWMASRLAARDGKRRGAEEAKRRVEVNTMSIPCTLFNPVELGLWVGKIGVLVTFLEYSLPSVTLLALLMSFGSCIYLAV